MSELLAKIERKTAHVVVIGLGYVGLPLALELARAGFRCTGLERDPERVRAAYASGLVVMFKPVQPEVLLRTLHQIIRSEARERA